MIILDTALHERAKNDDLVRVAIVGAGYMGRGIAQHILTATPGMRLVAMSNRNPAEAERAYRQGGIDFVRRVKTVDELEWAIEAREYAVTDDGLLICEARGIDVVVEATGGVEFGAQIAVHALMHAKHVVLMNAELDATVGPMLKVLADRAGVVISNTDGDQPGSIMNLFRFVTTIGYEPVLAGNIKGLIDPYRTPSTQKAFADAHCQKPRMITSFADGTKISMEMAVVSNATGFRVGKRGMFGPRCSHVNEAVDLFPRDLLQEGGIVDFVVGAEPGPGVFVLGYCDDPIKRQYMQYFKMGEGPVFVFYTPYHLPHVECSLTAARAALFHDATITPAGGPVCEVFAVAKRDLNEGEELDGIGGYTAYGVIDNAEICRSENLLPMGLAEGCRLIRSIPKDQPITMDDVSLPSARLCDELWRRQAAHFSTKLEPHPVLV